MNIDPNTLHTVGVVGSGAMGAGIAQIARTSGLKVVLHDVNAEALKKARGEIKARIERLVEKGSVSAELVEQIDERLVLASDITALAPAQVVIEAIVERLDAKQSLFAALEILHAGVRGCALLAQPVRYAEAVLDFVLACRSGDGGFARAPDALPNIELTHRALDVIVALCGDAVLVSSH